jgi:raffinose/stachyose/melibiose transport system substrate-binding protein
MKRIFLFVICILLVISPALFAQGGKATSEDDGRTVITFRSWSPVVSTTEKMIEAFEASHPDIKIDATIFNYPEYIVDLQTRAQSNTMPDIIGLEPGAMTQQFRKFLLPVQDRVVKYWGADWKDKFHPIGLDQARLGNPAGDENFYGLPVLVQTINMWYTVPVLEEAGFDVPTTYADMLELRDYFSKKGIAPMMVGAGDGWLRRDIYMQLIHNVAPGLIYKAEEGKAKFTDAPFVEAMSVWKRLFDDKIIQDGALGLSAYPGSQELIEAGRAATFPMGAWWMQMAGNPNPPPLSEGLVGYAPMIFPDVTGKGQPKDLLGGIDLMLGITKSAEGKEEAIEVFVDFIAGESAQALMNTFNDIPAVKGLAPQEEYFKSENQRNVWRILTEEWMPNVKYPRQLRSPEVIQALEDALAAVASGQLTPREGMQRVQDAWKPL